MPHDYKKQSKFLSYVLRHDPASIGLELDPQGWTDIAAVLPHVPGGITRAELDDIVASSDKQRFAISPDGKRIRANQGHSVSIDLALAPSIPPDQLFHGTAERNMSAILSEGLNRQARHHVHLSSDAETARKVGMRHGKPVILIVEATAMAAAGHVFFRSDNGVWLVDHVPPHFLTPLT